MRINYYERIQKVVGKFSDAPGWFCSMSCPNCHKKITLSYFAMEEVYGGLKRWWCEHCSQDADHDVSVGINEWTTLELPEVRKDYKDYQQFLFKSYLYGLYHLGGCPSGMPKHYNAYNLLKDLNAAFFFLTTTLEIFGRAWTVRSFQLKGIGDMESDYILRRYHLAEYFSLISAELGVEFEVHLKRLLKMNELRNDMIHRGKLIQQATFFSHFESACLMIIYLETKSRQVHRGKA